MDKEIDHKLGKETVLEGLGVTVAMLYIRSSDLIHLRAESMYPLSTSLHFSTPLPLASTFPLCFYEFDLLLNSTCKGSHVPM